MVHCPTSLPMLELHTEVPVFTTIIIVLVEVLNQQADADSFLNIVNPLVQTDTT